MRATTHWLNGSWLSPAAGIVLLASASTVPAACLQKPRQVAGAGAVYTLMLAPEGEVAGYLSEGFTRVECPTDLSNIRRYVDRICSASSASGLLALDTVALLGRSRSRACVSARAGLAEAGG
jgi:hypothetical protein